MGFALSAAALAKADVDLLNREKLMIISNVIMLEVVVLLLAGFIPARLYAPAWGRTSSHSGGDLQGHINETMPRGDGHVKTMKPAKNEKTAPSIITLQMRTN